MWWRVLSRPCRWKSRIWRTIYMKDAMGLIKDVFLTWTYHSSWDARHWNIIQNQLWFWNSSHKFPKVSYNWRIPDSWVFRFGESLITTEGEWSLDLKSAAPFWCDLVAEPSTRGRRSGEQTNEDSAALDRLQTYWSNWSLSSSHGNTSPQESTNLMNQETHSLFKMGVTIILDMINRFNCRHSWCRDWTRREIGIANSICHIVSNDVTVPTRLDVTPCYARILDAQPVQLELVSVHSS